VGEVLTTGEPTIQRDDDGSFMIVPLIARGRTLGAMTFAASRATRSYGDGELALAHDLAGRAALAIDNARLFRDQRHIATTLQRSLLPPSLPPIPGLEVAARYRAAGEGMEVGGDFFDVFVAGDEEWAVVIGDVCGKGPEAAAVTGLARNTIRAAATNEHRPSRLLRFLNEAIIDQIREDRFCTICYARLRPNPAGMRVTLSSGGHPLPIVARADGAIETAGVAGTLLGVFSEPELTDRMVDLGHGDRMVLFTDGLIEGRGGQAFGDQHLANLLRDCRDLDAEQVAERIEEAVLHRSPTGLRDDLAYIVLRVVSE
jgi:serine phosphatase RsbU (regulator of sigma subunit)